MTLGQEKIINDRMKNKAEKIIIMEELPVSVASFCLSLRWEICL